MDLYSAFVEDLETVGCFLDFQDTKESQIRCKIQSQTFLCLDTKPNLNLQCLTRSSALDDKNIPFPSSFFKYNRILCAQFKWGFFGFSIYWLNLWTSKVISGLVMVKYSGLPTTLLYMLVLPRISPSYVLSLMFYSIGVLTGLQQIEPASFSISNALLWQRVIPFSNRVTSNPRKNFKSPKSLSLNF